MLLREEPGSGVLAITQPAHAALSGRLAQAWRHPLPDDLVAHRRAELDAVGVAAAPFDLAITRVPSG